MIYFLFPFSLQRFVFILFIFNLVSYFFSISYGQSLLINSNRYQIDKAQKLIVCNQLPASLSTTITTIQLDHLYTFSTPVNSITATQFYPITYNDTTYQLSFTKLPIITIDTKGVSIVQNVDRIANFSLIDTTGAITTSYAGINIRGAFSSTFPKKSYTVEFWADTVSRVTKDVTLLDMRTDSDWLLLAMYNESLRINNVTSYALWRTMHQLYYISQEPTALSAIRTRYVDVFVNGSYAGVYALGEQLDRKQLQLKKTKDNGSVRGELYKTYDATNSTLFRGMDARNGNDTTWAGFELKYPKQPGFWTNMYTLVDSTVNWSDARFTSQIASKWQIDNLVDYFLFLNLVRATDNTGKNLYIARYKEGEPYIIIAWDLDGTWGFLYDGSRDNTTTDILSNGLYNRLLRLNPASFKQKLKARWFSLRTTLFATATLKSAFATNAALLTNNGAYLREATKWPVAAVNTELPYINTWIDNRTAFLDTYFGQIPDICTNPVAPTIGLSTTSITAGQSATITAAGCSYIVVWNTGETGSQLTISPSATANYWAVCNQTGAGCVSPASVTATLTVLPDTSLNAAQADLSLRVVSSRRVVSVNSTTRLTLSLTNSGPAMARTIRLQNRLPTGLAFAGNSVSAVSQLNGIVNIAIDSLDVNNTVQFSYDVQPTTAGLFRNAVQLLMATTHDPDSTPGSGTADGEDDMAIVDIRTPDNSTLVMESPNPNQRLLPVILSNQPAADSTRADLSLRIETDKHAVRLGGISTIKMIVSNAGGLAATGVAVQCVLPSGLQYIAGSGGSISGNIVSSSGLAIAVGSTTMVTFQVQTVSSGSWICKGEITVSDQADPDSVPGNGTTNGEDDEAWADLRVN